MRRLPVILTVLLLFLLIVGYPLSYAPAYKAYLTGVYEYDRCVCWSGPFGIYRPVEWMFDHTPLRGSLFAWASLWGVENELMADHNWRTVR
jgi:hypothetical protein